MHALDGVQPLALSQVTIQSEGIVRAAFDAARAHPLYTRSDAAARAAGLEEVERHHNAAGNLARRSTQAYAKSDAAFVKPTLAPTPPPF
jgi:hypothetical protein